MTSPAVESFFTDYLIAQRGASPHTIASYRDTFRLLFSWIREQAGTPPSDLDFTDVDAATVTGFLAMLEDERHNTGRTRSQRLAAIHSLFRHAALGHPEHAALIARVLAIRPRKPLLAQGTYSECAVFLRFSGQEDRVAEGRHVAFRVTYLDADELRLLCTGPPLHSA
jgi:integrase/recombinase XerD